MTKAAFPIALLVAAAAAAPVRAQSGGGPVESEFGILSNSIANLDVAGDTVWAGPYLSMTPDGGATWLVAGTDSLFGTSNRVFSMDIEGGTIWVGLGRSDQSQGTSVPSAAGFLVSTDGGRTFSFRFPQLDAPGDSTVTYGVNTLSALPVIVPQQSPPYDIDFDPATGTLYVAGWASGIRRSTDGGLTWSRVILPPDGLESIHPDSAYAFRVEPKRGGTGELNHMGFAVLVDETGTVWAGTPAGVNRSTDGGLSWRRFSSDGTSDGLTGSWVISIEEEPLPGRNPIWMATWNSGEAGFAGQFGVTLTRDGGETFEQFLHGERIYDFGFLDGVVYAAGDNGLFVTEDEGRTWSSIREFRDAARPDRFVRPGSGVLSVEATGDALWVGSGDGLLHSDDGGQTWTVHRVDVPLHPATPSDRVPSVDTYAYPNPFSPAVDGLVRIRYDLPQPGTLRIRVFDSAMNLVRELAESRQGGEGEVTWDGRDERGGRLANGVYFYELSGPGDLGARGKILVIE
jgi:hypothetical protein